MDITIKREDIERLLERATTRQQRFLRKKLSCDAQDNTDGASWNDGAEFAMQLTIDDLEILIEMIDDMAHGVYSIAR